MFTLKPVDLLVEINDEYVSVDIDQTTSFPFNLQMSDFTNPTATKIPYSSQISLPRTKLNDDLFNHIIQYDHQVLNFNPINRNNFKLYINNDLYQSGYLKLESVTSTSYKIRLYGGLGDFFYLLSEVSDERDMRIKSLDLNDIVKHKINKETIRNCWDKKHNKDNALTKTYKDYSTGTEVTNEVISYAMTYQGQYDNFDSDSVIGEDEEGIMAAIPVTWHNDKGKVYAAPSLNEHSRNTADFSGEYRSYYQRPMVRFSLLYNKIIEKITAEKWKVELDQTFFNKYNPYWNELWMICPQYDTTANNSGVSLKVGKAADKNWVSKEFHFEDGKDDIDIPTNYKNDIQKGQTYRISVNIPFKIRAIQKANSNKYLMLKRRDLKIYADVIIGTTVTKRLTYKEGAASEIELNKDTVAGKRPYDWPESNDFDYERRKLGDPTEINAKLPVGSIYTFIGAFNVDATQLTKSPELKLRIHVEGDTWWERYKHGDKNRSEAIRIDIQEGANILISADLGAGLRSGADVTLNSIIKSENTCYDFLMSYGKIFGLYCIKDIYEKKVSIVTRNTFFSNQEKLDWTYKIDYNKGIEMQPTPFDYKVGVFKWNDIGTKYEEIYLAETGKEYGSARFNTLYQFSDEEKNYLDNMIFDNCIIATDHSQYYLDRTPILYKDNKTLPFLQDNSGEKIEASFILIFKDGFENVEKAFAISDDEDAMLTYGYCWTDNKEKYITCKTYPKLTKFLTNNDKTYSLNFGSPAKVYNENEDNLIDENSTIELMDTIYGRFWRGYLKDKFNENNKQLTCYVLLTIEDIKTNLFNKFIYINDTIWVVERIVNFDPLSNAPTKVILSNVQEISAYLSQNYIEGNLAISRNGEGIYDPSGGDDGSVPAPNPVIIRKGSEKDEIELMINSTVDWNIGNLSSNVVVSPLSGSTKPTRLEISISENLSGGALYTNIPIIWGNTTTIVQILQVSNWTVTTSTNTGEATSLATDGTKSGESISVNDSTQVSLSTMANENWLFGYWVIDGVDYTSQGVELNVTNDVEAQAFWFEADKYVIMTTYDPHTSIPDVDRYPDRWILEIGNTYTFVNNQPNLSGYLFGSDTAYTSPAASISRMVGPTDSSLTAYYDSLLININIVNDSNSDFEAKNISLLSPTSTVVATLAEKTIASGSSDKLLFNYESNEYGVYTLSFDESVYDITISPDSLNYQSGSGVFNVDITVNALPELAIDPQITSVANGASTYKVSVTSNSDWSLTIDPLYADYMTASPLSGSAGNMEVTFNISVNPTPSERTGEAVFSTTTGSHDVSVKHFVTQEPGETGNIRVTLVNETGSVIFLTTPMEITIKNPADEVIESRTTNAIITGDNIFNINGLPVGDYTVNLSTYEGTSNGQNWESVPMALQEVTVVNGETQDVTYGFNLESL